MALTTETDLLTAIKSHRRTLLEREWHQQSLENGFPVMQTQAVQDVLKQVDNTDFECECGGTFDEYDRCSDCDQGHDDCDASECFGCLERAMDRAERMAEGMER